jgi:hypothetical protein
LARALPCQWHDVSDAERRCDDDDAVAAEILGYFEERPFACDDLRGISEWWLMSRRITVEVTTVARVLDRLTDAGVLERLDSGARCRYRLKAS